MAWKFNAFLLAVVVMQTAVVTTCVLAVIWVAWRLCSKRVLLPCPAEFDWLVEVENPLARATRSEQVVKQLAPRRRDRVMDVGCGPGRVTLPLARAVGPSGQVIALDVQAAMLAKVSRKAASEGITNVRLLQMSTGDKPVENGSLDGIVMVMALGEVPERVHVFETAFSALKTRGRLLVAESVFDPHFVNRRKVRERAEAAGFVEVDLAGNIFGYGVLFEKP